MEDDQTRVIASGAVENLKVYLGENGWAGPARPFLKEGSILGETSVSWVGKV